MREHRRFGAGTSGGADIPGTAGRSPAPAVVLRWCGQCAAGDGLVGRMAMFGARLAAADAAADAARGLDARADHAVPGAAAFHLRLPADRAPALARLARAFEVALRAGRRGPARRAIAHAWRLARLSAIAVLRLGADAGRLDRSVVRVVEPA